MATDDLDMLVRRRAFEFLADQTRVHGETLPWSLLQAGFVLEGRRVPLVSMQGIFKPALLPEMPLTIRTTPEDERGVRPYDDGFGPDGLLRYRYFGKDPSHPHNVGLRLAGERHRPLIHLFGLVKGWYWPRWPVYILRDDPDSLCVIAAVDEDAAALPSMLSLSEPALDARRTYITTLTKRRLHQQRFRMRVLRAYGERCAICRLGHAELLDAAHILPDGHPRGDPIVPNGLALCGLHHGAFDAHLLGIRPDLVIEVRNDILAEEDGPMLVHGLQEFQSRTIREPGRAQDKPRRDFLEERYELFRRAG